MLSQYINTTSYKTQTSVSEKSEILNVGSAADTIFTHQSLHCLSKQPTQRSISPILMSEFEVNYYFIFQVFPIPPESTALMENVPLLTLTSKTLAYTCADKILAAFNFLTIYLHVLMKNLWQKIKYTFLLISTYSKHLLL